MSAFAKDERLRDKEVGRSEATETARSEKASEATFEA